VAIAVHCGNRGDAGIEIAPTLLTSNLKHFSAVEGLQIEAFLP
jgi:hypothetical protein